MMFPEGTLRVAPGGASTIDRGDGGTMHAIGRMAALPLAAFALACGGESTKTASKSMDASMQKDLALASSPNLELASSARSQRQQMVVSDIERTRGAAPVRAATKSKAPNKAAAPARTPTVVAVHTPKPEVPQAPTVVAQADPAPVPADPEPPVSISPRPEPPVIVSPSPGIEIGRRQGGGLGGIIGVVIRGGGVDGDHCDPRGTVGARRGGISINHRFPVHVNLPMYRP
jgi:hypothetical protein